MRVQDMRLFCLLTWFAGVVFGAAIQTADEKTVYEPNPPVTKRVLMGINFTHPETKQPMNIDVGIELYGSVVPKTVDNFYALAKGVKGQLGEEVIDISYKHTMFYRIISDFMMQGGIVLPKVGPFSIYGYKFDDESFDLKHDRPGRVSMANAGPNTNACQFFITTSNEPMPHLDGKHVVFGQVISGLEDLMRYVQHVETDENDKPLDDVTITYTYSEELKIGNLEQQHEDWKKKVEQFRNGDKSVGITLEQELAQGAKDEVKLENDYYYYQHPYAKFVFGMLFLGGLFTVYANRRSIIPRARNIVSVRS